VKKVRGKGLPVAYGMQPAE